MAHPAGVSAMDAVTSQHAGHSVTYDFSRSGTYKSIALSDLVLLAEQQVDINVAERTKPRSHVEDDSQSHARSSIAPQDGAAHLEGPKFVERRTSVPVTPIRLSSAAPSVASLAARPRTYVGGPASDVDSYMHSRFLDADRLATVMELRSRKLPSHVPLPVDGASHPGDGNLVGIDDLYRARVRENLAAPVKTSPPPLSTLSRPASRDEPWKHLSNGLTARLRSDGRVTSPQEQRQHIWSSTQQVHQSEMRESKHANREPTEVQLRSLPVTHPAVMSRLVDMTKLLSKEKQTTSSLQVGEVCIAWHTGPCDRGKT
jgi:hypothetical protein